MTAIMEAIQLTGTAALTVVFALHCRKHRRTGRHTRTKDDL